MKRRYTLMLTLGLCASIAAAAVPVTRHMQIVQGDEQPDWQHLSETLSLPAVDARADRVWKAIPGLCGWKLDIPASRRATEMAHDDLLHLRFHSVKPATSLADLPPNPIYRGPAEEKSVCLMFNVSWGEAYVPAILQTLQKTHVTATFFVDGDFAKKFPELTHQIAASGQCIGSHGTGHKDFHKLSTAALNRQMHQTNEILKAVTGVQPKAVAPPAGSYDERTVTAAKDAGMYTILWTIDTVDWRRPPKETIVNRVVNKIEPGALILMHPTAPTAQALPEIILGLKDKGYTFKSINQLLAEKPVVQPPATLSAKS